MASAGPAWVCECPSGPRDPGQVTPHGGQSVAPRVTMTVSIPSSSQEVPSVGSPRVKTLSQETLSSCSSATTLDLGHHQGTSGVSLLPHGTGVLFDPQPPSISKTPAQVCIWQDNSDFSRFATDL